MVRKNTVLTLGIISIVILLTIQVIITLGVWKQKDEMFNLRYRLYSQDALASMSRKWGTDGFDTARLLISAYSASAVKQITEAKSDSAIQRIKDDALFFTEKVLNKEQDLSPYLSDYFGRQGVDRNFNYKVVINFYGLINGDKRIPVYVNEEFASRRPVRPDTTQPRTRIAKRRPSPEILVLATRSEDNNYRLDFAFLIDFSDKKSVILKESAAYLSLSLFSILVVVLLFIITYRNLMEEKRLSNLKTDFINNMTHELKTPLSTITVAGRTLEMAQIRSNEEKVLETAKLIGKQSVHLNQLINMILEISMWERTQFELDKKKVQIEEIMNDIVTSFRTGCGNCATLREKYSFNGESVDLDPVYFTTLMNNLLSNAVKYSDREPEINIEGFAQDNTVFISVADNGIGISKNDQKHVFDKFYRASTGNIHKYKGLGLGLYYVRKIAEAHGGDVTVSSKPGKGSIFTVSIPY
jgi:two-component system, OmpR family, phosphate regulon sensor histidine kinase PhoR